MGSVYLAEDTHLGRRVAIKFPSLGSDSHDNRARFLREARAVSELSHPGIATLFDYGETAEGRPFLVMELAHGRPMSELMQKGELNLPRALGIVIDVATALTEAHARGVIHRDIKPSNIMIDDHGKVKVLDFGLAKQLNRDHQMSSEPEAQTLLSTETRSGIVLGTPAYLSPEQAIGGAVDGRSDLFALGTLLYEAITGRTPFSGKSFIEVAANVLHVEPPAPSKINPSIPPQLDFITLKALAKKPNKRYQSAKELIDDLTDVKDQLEEVAGQTLIRRTSPSVVAGANKTLSNLSQILQRPRIPISYILVGVAGLLIIGAVAFYFLRPTVYVPPAEAKRWYDIGTTAIRDGAFFQASQALEKAIAADDRYMLARARLAEALVELDYVDRAKDELLRVSGTDRATLPTLDLLYLDAITATARRDVAKAIDLYNQILKQVPEAEKAYVFVDLGRAYENNNDAKNAIQSYKEATNRHSQYPTAHLRLGIIYGQLGDLDAALTSFAQAESIYQAMGKLEGRGEVLFQRGALFNKRNKLAEAKTQLEQALILAKANDNKAQTIKTLLQLCSVAFDSGETALSTVYAQQALELAQKSGMENLSIQGLVDLSQSLLVRGNQGEVEKYLGQALAAAERVKAKRTEARARFTMAGLRQQQNRFDEAVKFLEPALAFYQQGGYRSETLSCLALLARTNSQKGDYAAAARVQEELLRLAQELNDQSMIALAHAERGSALSREERFAESIERLGQAYAIYSAQGIQRSMGYNLASRGSALANMGRFAEARGLLDQAAAIADKPGGELKRLSVEVKLARADIALKEGNYAAAKSAAQEVIQAAGTDFKSLTLGARIVLGLAQFWSGASAAGKQQTADALALAKQVNDPSQIATAQLALAEVMLISGDFKGAASNAQLAEQFFRGVDRQSSRWRALAVSALATDKLGDKTMAREYATQAKDSLSKIEERLGADNYQSYLRRPDIQHLSRQLDSVTSSG